ncbi:MAG: hypothetical protein ACMZI0_07725 [Symbiopectobacterium sp.]|uniref:hypothetical protein n=1 Tax=Symbiopectobacterium sp. TaxID=2952789 RepID=UPI0039E92AC6
MKLNSLSRLLHVNRGEFALHTPKKPDSLSKLHRIGNSSVELRGCKHTPMPPAGTVAFRQTSCAQRVWLPASLEMIVSEGHEKAL